MSRKVISASLALALAGGVYLAGAPAEASNMGFKLERSFDLVRTGTRAHQNLYFVSFPLFNGLADLANSSRTDTFRNSCVGETGSAPATDNVIDSDDGICDMWQSRQGDFLLQKINVDNCQPQGVTATIGLGGIPTFTGNPFLLDTTIGYQVVIGSAANPTLSPQNRAVIVGSHDPSFAGQPIVASAGCAASAPRLTMINLPYHTMFETANEVLCGLEGLDWQDADSNGDPDTCPDGNDPANAGIPWDGANPLIVTTFDNDANVFIGRTVQLRTFPVPPRAVFVGNNFSLRPGDSYLMSMVPAHQATTFLSPHF